MKFFYLCVLFNFYSLIFISYSIPCYSPLSTQKIGQVYNGSCYIIFTSPKKNFQEARDICKQNFHPKADLVKVSNQQTTNFLINLKSGQSGIWIGLYNLHQLWISDNSSSNLGIYQNWATLEPNGDGEYAEMKSDGTWNDIPDYKIRSFFCSFPLETCEGLTYDQNNTKLCNNAGSCIGPNECLCFDPCHVDNLCSSFQCNQIIATNTSKICSGGHGDCVQCNLCNCTTKGRYGNDCQEIIGDIGSLNGKDKIITIPYNISEWEVTSRFSGNNQFNCLNFIQNPNTIFGITFSISCHFKFGLNKFEIKYSKMIDRIILKSNISLILKSVSNPNDRIFITILDKTPIYLLPLNLPIIYATIIIGFISCGFIIFIIGLSIFVIFMVVISNMKSKKKLDATIFKLIENRESFGNKAYILEMEDSERLMASFHINKMLFQIHSNDINIIKKIGSGGFAQVYKAEWEGKIVAFKCFKTTELCGGQEDFSSFEKEIKLLLTIKHPNIVDCYGASYDSPRVGMILEYCENGDLNDFIKIEENINIQVKINILKGICCGMKYLHKRNIIHRDIKLENILLDDKYNPKITDFGISSIKFNNDTEKTKHIGTSYYMAPEVTRGEQYDEKCDVFSFGILWYALWVEKCNPYAEQQRLNQSMFNIEYKVAHNPDFRPTFTPEFLSKKKEIKEILMVNKIKQCWYNDS